jgi:CheY-like chemotaxis protein
MEDSGRPLVLVVDDDPRVRELLELLLRADGYRVIAAADGAAALEAVAAHAPRAVLVDLRMPGMDGTEVCRRVRQTRAPDRVPIIMLTGMDDAGTRRDAIAAGADAVLVKPVDRRALREHLARLCMER